MKHTASVVCLCVCVVLSLWLRLIGTSDLPPGQFTAMDAYLYYQQAETIAARGHLPAREMHRWVPVGRDTTQTLNLYAYALAYGYRWLKWTTLTLYSVVVYTPAMCFCLALAGLCVFLWWVYGFRIAIITCVILTTLPATIERSAAGFGDRDAWCLMLGTFAVITYLSSLRAQDERLRLLWTLVSGFLMLLGGLSWEGFATFGFMILGIWVWRFLTIQSDGRLKLDAVWVFVFLPALLIASPAYRMGIGYSRHLFVMLLLPPLIFLGIRGLHVFLIRRSAWADVLKPHARTLAMGLTLNCLLIAGISLLIEVKGWQVLTVSYSQDAFWKSIGELKAPHFGYWLFRYGSIFIIGSVGLAVAPLLMSGKNALVLSICLLCFAMLVFFRHPLDRLWERPAFGDALFVITLFACGVLFVRLAVKSEAVCHENTAVFTGWVMLFWGLLFFSLARDAKRFDFFIGIPLALFTALFIVWVAENITRVLTNPKYITLLVREKLPQSALNIGLTVVLLLFAMCWGLKDGGYLLRTHYAATQLRSAKPGRDTPVTNALLWMRQHFPEDAIVAAEWSFGNYLNALAGVKTITDADHYIPHWIALYQEHVRTASSEREALEFLKTHGATHLMMTHKQPKETLLHGELSDAFEPMYPENDFQNASVKLWQLRYPPDIQPKAKFLAIEPQGDTSP